MMTASTKTSITRIRIPPFDGAHCLINVPAPCEPHCSGRPHNHSRCCVYIASSPHAEVGGPFPRVGSGSESGFEEDAGKKNKDLPSRRLASSRGGGNAVAIVTAEDGCWRWFWGAQGMPILMLFASSGSRRRDAQAGSMELLVRTWTRQSAAFAGLAPSFLLDCVSSRVT